MNINTSLNYSQQILHDYKQSSTLNSTSCSCGQTVCICAKNQQNKNISKPDSEEQDKLSSPKESVKSEDLSKEEQEEVRKLQQRDREVKQHEQAHIVAAAGYAGAASYEYVTGPDNKSYAVGGEVSIDVSPAENPKKTVQKMRIVKAAAMAPSNPSAQDYAVASQAAQMEMQAQLAISQEENQPAKEASKKQNSEGKLLEEAQTFNLFNNYANINISSSQLIDLIA